jgi:hypothetical protein
MLTWKVWAENDDLLFEGTEDEARAYIVGSQAPSSLTLESLDGYSYCCRNGNWVLRGASEFWGSIP